MDNKDGRRSRVPAGTFGGSNPPPASDEITESGEGEAGDEPTRPGLRRVAPPPAPPRRPSADMAGELERRHVSTLVGHPTGASVPPPNPAPMLAPPKWTGASAYVEGQEPQPRVSALPAPQHVPLPPDTSSGEPSRSRVTTKVGHAQVQPHPVPPPPPESATRAPAIGDAIQEMLDSQTAVSMQMQAAEELRMDRISEEAMPIDEQQIEEILDGLSESKAPPPPAPRLRERDDEPTLQHAAPPPPDAPPVAAINPFAFASDRELPEPARPAPPAPAAPVAQARAVPEPAPAAQDKEPAKEPAPAKDVARPRRAAVELGMHDAASSLAPAEVRGRPRYRDDSQPGLGILLLAAMGVIGVGGWYLTKGSYPGARPRPAQASAAVDSASAITAPAAKVLPPTVAAPAAPATAAPASGTEGDTAAAAPAEPATAKHAAQDGAKRADAKPRASVKSSAEAREDAVVRDDAVVKVTPRPDSAEMPDIPSRDNVVAALTPLRPAVAQCAHGQRGVAQLDITVANTGTVTHAVVGGDFAGTSEGSCIARAARSAVFAPFKKPRFRVIYPFSL
jgi:hypothetical protein